jgi:hypothetical protein
VRQNTYARSERGCLALITEDRSLAALARSVPLLNAAGTAQRAIPTLFLAPNSQLTVRFFPNQHRRVKERL